MTPSRRGARRGAYPLREHFGEPRRELVGMDPPTDRPRWRMPAGFAVALVLLVGGAWYGGCALAIVEAHARGWIP